MRRDLRATMTVLQAGTTPGTEPLAGFLSRNLPAAMPGTSIETANGCLPVLIHVSEREMVVEFSPDGHVKSRLVVRTVLSSTEASEASLRAFRALAGTDVREVDGGRYAVAQWSPYQLGDAQREPIRVGRWVASAVARAGSILVPDLVTRPLSAHGSPDAPVPSDGSAVLEIEARLAALSASLRTLESALLERDDEIRRLTDEAEALASRVDRAEEDRRVALDALEELSASAASAAAEHGRQAEAEATLAAALSDAVALRARVASAEADRDLLRRDLDDARTSGHASELRRRDLERDAHELRSALAAARVELAGLRAEASPDDVARLQPPPNDTTLAATMLRDLRRTAAVDHAGLLIVAERAAATAPTSAALREELGIARQLAGDQAGTVDALAGIDANALGADGVAALVIATLGTGRIPEPIHIVSRVDWAVGTTFERLVRLVPQMRPEAIVAVTREIPFDGAQMSTWLQLAIDRPLARSEIRSLLEIWEAHDLDGAARALVALCRRRVVFVDDDWVRDSMERALGTGSRLSSETITLVLDQLVERARRRRDVDELGRLAQRGVELISDESMPASVLRVARSAVQLGRRSTMSGDLLQAVLAAHAAASVWGQAGAVREIEALMVQMRELSVDAATLIDEVLGKRAGTNGNGVIRRRSPTTILEAVRMAAEDRPSLIVLEEAFDSATRSRFPNSQRAYEALCMVAEVSDLYHAGQTPSGVDFELGSRGFTYAEDVSDTAKQAYREDYVRHYRGREIVLGPHISFGRKTGGDKVLRIYMYIDDQDRRIIVGHVGSHLRGAGDS